MIREEIPGKMPSIYTYDDDGNLLSKTENGKIIGYSYADDKLTSYLGHNLTWTMGRQLSSFDNIVMHNVIIEVISSTELFNDKTLSTLVKAKCSLDSIQCERSSRLFVRLSPPNFFTDLSCVGRSVGLHQKHNKPITAQVSLLELLFLYHF